MVHLLVLPHTVCDSSPKCSLHYVGVFGWKHCLVHISYGKPVLI